MTNITVEQAIQALISLTENELEELSKFKALELMNGMTFNFFKVFMKIEPATVPICQENLKIVCQAMSEKSCDFFGLEINITGEKLEKFIGYMAAEFRKSKGEGKPCSEYFLFLEQKICVRCNTRMIPHIQFLAQTNRFVPDADIAVMQHIKSNLQNEQILQLAFSIFEDGNFTIISL